MWDRANVDVASVPAPTSSEHTVRNPTDRGKLGCKHHLLVDLRGLSLVAQISGAPVYDSRLLIFSQNRSQPCANVQVSGTLIEPALQECTEPGCADEGPRHGSHATAWRHAHDSADGVVVEHPLGGYTVFSGCTSVMNGGPTSIRLFFCSPAHSSAGGTSRGLVRHSKSVRIDALRALIAELCTHAR